MPMWAREKAGVRMNQVWFAMNHHVVGHDLDKAINIELLIWSQTLLAVVEGPPETVDCLVIIMHVVRSCRVYLFECTSAT